MPKDSGRTGRAGNKKGTPGSIQIRMRDPEIHLRGGTATGKYSGRANKGKKK